MPAIFIRMMLKVFSCESPFFYEPFHDWVFLGGVHSQNYSLILNYKAKSCLFPLFAACTSGEYLNGFSGFFSTPNFPSNFPQHSKCTWNITVPSGYIIKLSFLYFRLEPYQYFPCYNAPEARVTVTNVASDDGYQPFMLCGQLMLRCLWIFPNVAIVRMDFHNKERKRERQNNFFMPSKCRRLIPSKMFVWVKERTLKNIVRRQSIVCNLLTM